MKKHPILTYIYVYLLDITAITILIYAIFHLKLYPVSVWVSFVLWTFILCVARLGGLFELIGLKISTGWAAAIELAAAIVLPLPLFCISIVISFITIVFRRIRTKHAEPLLGPDFNASNNIVGAFVMGLIGSTLNGLLGNTDIKCIVELLAVSFTFSILQILFLTILISIDEGKSITNTGTMDKDSVITEVILIMVGALIGQIYRMDPYLIILILMPLSLLHNTMKKINDSKLIYIDEKTGLYNYRYYDEKLNELFTHTVQNRDKISHIFGDMDFLRNINNNYGHQNGDNALLTVAAILKDIRINGSVVSRFGGEEFVIILPGYSKEDAYEVAESVRAKIERTPVMLDNGNPLSITMSFGVSSYPEDASTIQELVKTSDEALYVAKNLGRNRVGVYTKD